MLNVMHVKIEFLFDGEGPPAGDLGESGESGLYIKSSLLVLAPFGDLGDIERSRPDERHVPLKDVKQLRKFVERRLPQESAYACQSLVLARLGTFSEGVDIAAHGSEFAEYERSAIDSGPLLSEYDRAVA